MLGLEVRDILSLKPFSPVLMEHYKKRKTEKGKAGSLPLFGN
jgi:hypothetical protein